MGKMNRIRKRNKIIGFILFVIYLIFLGYFLFFSEAFGRDAGSALHGYNWELFKEIRRFYLYREQLGMDAFLINVFGNVLAFVPFGFFRPIIGRRKHSLYRTVLQGFMFSLAIEFVQIRLNVGSFDVDDIFLNTLGCVLGYILFVLFYRAYQQRTLRRLRKKEEKDV